LISSITKLFGNQFGLLMELAQTVMEIIYLNNSIFCWHKKATKEALFMTYKKRIVE